MSNFTKMELSLVTGSPEISIWLPPDGERGIIEFGSAAGQYSVHMSTAEMLTFANLLIDSVAKATPMKLEPYPLPAGHGSDDDRIDFDARR